MRKTLAAAALGAGLLTAVLPVAPATAYCDTLTSAITGGCSNPCTVAAGAYQRAYNASRGLLPEVQFLCYA